MNHEITQELGSGFRLFGEIPGSSPRVRAWVGIYPFKGTPYGPRPDDASALPWRFRIRKFEVDKKLTEGNFDVHEAELERAENWIVDSVEEVLSVLSRWPTLLLVRHLADYPI